MIVPFELIAGEIMATSGFHDADIGHRSPLLTNAFPML